MEHVGIHFVASVSSDFRMGVAAGGVWSTSQAGGGAGMVIPLTPGFLPLTCGAPDQMGVLFLGSPPGPATDQELLLHWS